MKDDRKTSGKPRRDKYQGLSFLERQKLRAEEARQVMNRMAAMAEGAASKVEAAAESAKAQERAKKTEPVPHPFSPRRAQPSVWGEPVFSDHESVMKQVDADFEQNTALESTDEAFEDADELIAPRDAYAIHSDLTQPSHEGLRRAVVWKEILERPSDRRRRRRSRYVARRRNGMEKNEKTPLDQ